MPAIEEHDHRHHFQVLYNRREIDCVRRALAMLAMHKEGAEGEFIRAMLSDLDRYVAKRLDEIHADTKQINLQLG